MNDKKDLAEMVKNCPTAHSDFIGLLFECVNRENPCPALAICEKIQKKKQGEKV